MICLELDPPLIPAPIRASAHWLTTQHGGVQLSVAVGAGLQWRRATAQSHNRRVHDRLSQSGETVQSPWSEWGVRLVAVLAAVFAVSLGWIWIESFYRSIAASTQLSFMSSDRPYMPLHTIAKPIIGVHYFGDFQLPLGYATNIRHSISPYFGSSIPAQYPPFSQILFLPFSFLPLQASAVVYLSLSAAIFLVPLWLLLAPLKTAYRIILLVPVAVLTTPFLSFLDRGNDIGIVVGLIAWGIWAWRSERWVLCGALLAAAIALKAYPAALLVVPLGLRRYRFTVLVAMTAVVANLLALVVFPGGYIRNLRAVLPALEGKIAPLTQLSSWSLYSLIPKTSGLLFGNSSVTPLLAPKSPVIWLPGILYILGVFVVIRKGRVPQWCWGPLSLASIQLVAPLSFVYTTAWAPVAAVWFAWGGLVEIRDGDLRDNRVTNWVLLRTLLLLGLTATLVPSIFSISGTGGFDTPAARFVSPAVLMVTLGVAIFYSLTTSGVEPKANLVAD